MILGVLMLGAWLGGKSRWFGGGVLDRAGDSKNDRQFLDLYFVALVLAPLLFGGILIVFALRAMY